MKTKSKNKSQFDNEGKPVIRYVENVKLFTRSTKKEPSGIAISDEQARKHWSALDSDWTMGAYNEMARRAMCSTCNGDGKIMQATGDRKHPLQAIHCPHCLNA